MSSVKEQNTSPTPLAREQIPVRKVSVSCFIIPTEEPESDGTLTWDSTKMIYVEVSAADQTGIGYTYADESTARFIREHLEPVIMGRNVMENTLLWNDLYKKIRNMGNTGLASMAISAVDIALWDLKSKLLKLPLTALLGRIRDKTAVYGSGGFTSYSRKELRKQFEEWMKAGIFMFKMKVGRHPQDDPERVREARKIIGDTHELFVDANGAYPVREALKYASSFHEQQVYWFEEPVSSEDSAGLRFVREHVPPEMNVAAGEYCYTVRNFHRLLQNGSVDVLQADATRCGGITGFMKAGTLCDAYGIPLSAHTAPSIHTYLCCCVSRAIHLEYFHDHERIEQLFFEGRPVPVDGHIAPDMNSPGLGIRLRKKDAEKYLVYEWEGETGTRRRETGNRKPETGERGITNTLINKRNAG